MQKIITLIPIKKMKTAIISDIHSNLEAFTAVLEDIKKNNINKIYCAGDLIGYGPNPNEIVKAIIDNNIKSVGGNHDYALTDNLLLEEFNSYAKKSILITRKIILPEYSKYISNLPVKISKYNFLLVHGCPPESFTKYLTYVSDDELKDIFIKSEHFISFTGHSHVPEIIRFNNGNIIKHILKKGFFILDSSDKYFINAGSVGQSRDNNNKAKYIIYNTDDYSIDLRYVEYDIDKTAQKIFKSDLPPYNAERLFFGV